MFHGVIEEVAGLADDLGTIAALGAQGVPGAQIVEAHDQAGAVVLHHLLDQVLVRLLAKLERATQRVSVFCFAVVWLYIALEEVGVVADANVLVLVPRMSAGVAAVSVNRHSLCGNLGCSVRLGRRRREEKVGGKRGKIYFFFWRANP